MIFQGNDMMTYSLNIPGVTQSYAKMTTFYG